MFWGITQVKNTKTKKEGIFKIPQPGKILFRNLFGIFFLTKSISKILYMCREKN